MLNDVINMAKHILLEYSKQYTFLRRKKNWMNSFMNSMNWFIEIKFNWIWFIELNEFDIMNSILQSFIHEDRKA
jgi:hypothetical protein